MQVDGLLAEVADTASQVGVVSSHTQTHFRVDPVEKLETLAGRLPPSIVKGSFSGATDWLLAVLVELKTAPPSARVPFAFGGPSPRCGFSPIGLKGPARVDDPSA